MTTVVNNPPSSNNSNGGVGIIVGVIVFLVVAYIFFMYGLPAIKNIGSPQVNIPNKVDVNVKLVK